VTTPAGPPAPNALQDILGAFLDVLGMLAVAAGVAWGLWRWWGPFSLVAAGLVLILLSSIAATMRDASEKPAHAVESNPPRGPGPESPGPLHVSGR
jgi:hypothetical protein